MKKILIIMLLSVVFCSHSYARNTDQIIQELDEMIAVTTDSVKLSELHMFKARNYQNAGKNDLSIKSYLQALKQNQKGAVWAELGSMYFKTGDYNNSAKVASKIVNSFPGQKKEGLALLEKSNKKLEEIYLKENPPTIIVNSQFKGKLSRMDVLKEVQRRDAAMGVQRFSYVNNSREKNNRKRIQDIAPPKSIGDMIRYKRERQAILDDRQIAKKGNRAGGKRVQDIAPPKSIGDMIRYKRERQAILDDNGIKTPKKKPPQKNNYQTKDAHGNLVQSNSNYQTKDAHGNLVQSNSNYQTRDAHGNLVQSNSNYQTRDAHGNLVQTQK